LKSEIKDIFRVASIYMATIIGAGFASGQEIMQFFSTYYKGGFYGIILAGILFAAIGYIVLNKVYKERIRNYEEFLFPSVGWFLGWVMEIVVSIFMASVLCIMISGISGIITDETGVAFPVAVLMVSFFCMVVFMMDLKAIMALSTFITPILIAGIMGVGIYIISSKHNPVFNITESFGSVTQNWMFSALLYVSYNSITAVVVMCSLLPYLKSRKVASVGGILGGIMLSSIAIIINFALYLFYPEVIVNDFPVLYIVDRYNSVLSSIYTYILMLAMIISAVTAGYGFIERVSSKVNIGKRLVIFITCGLAIPFSNIGFSGLISTIYPVFGYVGMFMVFVILLQGLSMTGPVFARSKGKGKQSA